MFTSELELGREKAPRNRDKLTLPSPAVRSLCEAVERKQHEPELCLILDSYSFVESHALLPPSFEHLRVGSGASATKPTATPNLCPASSALETLTRRLGP